MHLCVQSDGDGDDVQKSWKEKDSEIDITSHIDRMDTVNKRVAEEHAVLQSSYQIYLNKLEIIFSHQKEVFTMFIKRVNNVIILLFCAVQTW